MLLLVGRPAFAARASTWLHLRSEDAPRAGLCPPPPLRLSGEAPAGNHHGPGEAGPDFRRRAGLCPPPPLRPGCTYPPEIIMPRR